MRRLIIGIAASGLLAVAAGPGVAAASARTLSLHGKLAATSFATHRSRWVLSEHRRVVGSLMSRCNDQTLVCAVTFRLPHGTLRGDFKLGKGTHDRGTIHTGSGRYRHAKGWFGMAFSINARSMQLQIHLR